MNDDAVPSNWQRQTEERTDRHAARVRRFARARLPKWVPDALAGRYARALKYVVQARRDVRRPRNQWVDQILHGPLDPQTRLRYAEEHAELLHRLAHYNGMHAAWHTITTRERIGLARPDLAADVDLVVGLLIDRIDFLLVDFDRLPKRTAKERKDGAGRVARLAAKLAQAIEDDVDGRALANRYLARQVIVEHHREHEADDKPLPLEHYPIHMDLWDNLFPPYDPFNRVSDTIIDETGDDAPFDSWSAHDRLAWLLRCIQRLPLSVLLRDFATDLQRVANTEPEISRPNSGHARARFLIRRLSKFMHGYYGSPLDNAVALFVSAALDLPVPLGRDEVRDATGR